MKIISNFQRKSVDKWQVALCIIIKTTTLMQITLPICSTYLKRAGNCTKGALLSKTNSIQWVISTWSSIRSLGCRSITSPKSNGTQTHRSQPWSTRINSSKVVRSLTATQREVLSLKVIKRTQWNCNRWTTINHLTKSRHKLKQLCSLNWFRNL